MKVIQRGNSFYAQDQGWLYSANVNTNEGDIIGLSMARGEFKVWAEKNNLQYVWA